MSEFSNESSSSISSFSSLSSLLLKEINSDELNVVNDHQDIDNIPSTSEAASLTEQNKRLFFVNLK